MEQTNQQQPLILVFYLDPILMAEPQIIQPFIQGVNEQLEKKNANVLAYFLRCAEGESERVTCINPIQVEPAKMEEINKMVEDIKKQFDINQSATIKKCTCIEGEACSNCNN